MRELESLVGILEYPTSESFGRISGGLMPVCTGLARFDIRSSLKIAGKKPPNGTQAISPDQTRFNLHPDRLAFQRNERKRADIASTSAFASDSIASPAMDMFGRFEL